MPRGDDREELGNEPTAVTSVVPEQRNRESTQQIAVPDPLWADGALPSDTVDPTTHSAVTPDSSPTTKLKMLVRDAAHEFSKLPLRTRTLVVAAASLLIGLVFGLVVAPGGKSAKAEADELSKFAQRLSLPEKDSVRRALTMGDPVSALLMLRAMTAKDHLGADPVAIALRGRLSLVAKDTVDALDNFETAVTAQPKLMDEAWFPAAIIQTYAANKPARTGALVSRLARPPALEALQRACSDLQYRVRHGAMDALKGMSASCSDPVSVLVLDAYQADKCDAARSVITDLLPHAATDDRVAAALDALSRRPPVAKCVADLIPHK